MANFSAMARRQARINRTGSPAKSGRKAKKRQNHKLDRQYCADNNLRITEYLPELRR